MAAEGKQEAPAADGIPSHVPLGKAGERSSILYSAGQFFFEYLVVVSLRKMSDGRYEPKIAYQFPKVFDPITFCGRMGFLRLRGKGDISLPHHQSQGSVEKYPMQAPQSHPTPVGAIHHPNGITSFQRENLLKGQKEEEERLLQAIPLFCFPDGNNWEPVTTFPRYLPCCGPTRRAVGCQSCPVPMHCISLQRNLFLRPDKRGWQQEDWLLQEAAGELWLWLCQWGCGAMSTGGCLMGLGFFLSAGMSVGCWVEESSPKQSWDVGGVVPLPALGIGMRVLPTWAPRSCVPSAPSCVLSSGCLSAHSFWHDGVLLWA